MEAQFNRLTRSIPQQEIVDIIRNNLLPDYMKALVLHDISTIPELTSLCERIEDSLQPHRDYRSTPRRNIIYIIFLRYLNHTMYLQMFVVGMIKNLVISVVIARLNVQFSVLAMTRKELSRHNVQFVEKPHKTRPQSIDVAGPSGQVKSKVQKKNQSS
ncbi:hypothetical protein HHI36_017065 [Cryptolaemus montrouzieri]|uniref:Uncharacterized protein n=1 Tax=Cryptolaemus montrouzieri TaxID=559131 RepID=A0ABD2NLK3_9CUCU